MKGKRMKDPNEKNEKKMKQERKRTSSIKEKCERRGEHYEIRGEAGEEEKEECQGVGLVSGWFGAAVDLGSGQGILMSLAMLDRGEPKRAERRRKGTVKDFTHLQYCQNLRRKERKKKKQGWTEIKSDDKGSQ